MTHYGPLNNGILKVDYVLGPHHHFSGMYLYQSGSGQIDNLYTGTSPQGEVDVTNKAVLYGSLDVDSEFQLGERLEAGYTTVITFDSSRGRQTKMPADPWPTGYGMFTGVNPNLYPGIPAGFHKLPSTVSVRDTASFWGPAIDQDPRTGG